MGAGLARLVGLDALEFPEDEGDAFGQHLLLYTLRLQAVHDAFPVPAPFLEVLDAVNDGDVGANTIA
ncbi:MAG: hypothetical protein IH957_07480 [Chloroflexi bacterium]|nr:hypothetical protein [Chloroflexota bacterium]